jgi:hypothetical protein
MSEKIYALLLRLFPSHFRKAYGEEALQLFRDRTRDERGLLPGFQLWFDLLADLTISVPREYFYAEPELFAASSQGLDGTPSFYVLGDQSPRPGALFLGGMMSLVALLTFSSLLSRGGNSWAPNASLRQFQRAAASPSSGRPVPQAAGDANSPGAGDDETIASTSGQPAATAAPSSPSQDNAGNPQSTALPQPDLVRSPHLLAPQLRNAARTIATEVQRDKLDASERQRVIDGAIANLRLHYIYPDVAQQMADTLLAHQKRGDDDAMTDGDSFANQLTKQMRDVSHDMHLELVYSRDPLPQRQGGQSREAIARYRKAMKQENCTFEKVEILPRNIGYLKLNSFPDPAVCQSTAKAAMVSLNHVEALIIDLRDNHGGEPDMVALMAAYLFDHPEYWYNPRENTTKQSWTRSPVPGNRLADKPVYVLMSGRTFSGAEQFCYDLKMLKRVTLVGETTGGAAHSGVWHRIDNHFGMGIPETKPINPFSQTDWAETGVEPDVKVKSADALETARKLAEGKLQKK